MSQRPYYTVSPIPADLISPLLSPLCTDADYQFSQLNVAVADLPTYTDDEYAKLIAPLSGDWSRADTDHLMELARQFDRRFIVIHDRSVCVRVCRRRKLRRAAELAD